jgi:hypothetical protein
VRVVKVAAVLGVVAVAAGVLVWKSTSSYDSKPAKTDLSFFSAVTAAFSNQVDSATATIQHPTDFGVWWIDKDKHSIINDAAPTVEYRATICEGDNLKQDRYRALVRKLRATVASVMAANGFTKNLRNSSRNLADDSLYDYVQAYERGDLKAVLSASPDCWSSTGIGAMYYSINFAYTKDFVANAAKQRPFLKDLNLGSDVIIHIGKRVGAWAVVNVNYRRTGHYILAKRIDNVWTKIFAGQDMPPCTIVRKWKIPASIGTCYEPSA